MNEMIKKTSEDASAGQPAQPSLKSSSRRRLIKLGTAGVPVVATLASSPALAWHCRTASAWGSNMSGTMEQLAAGSQKANKGVQYKPDDCLYIEDFATTTGGAALCSYNRTKYKAMCGSQASTALSTAKVSKLISTYALTAPVGVDLDETVGSLMNNTSGRRNFARHMIAAQLNYLLSPSGGSIQWCAANSKNVNQLKLMAGGTYTPEASMASWDQTKIITYLENNWIARSRTTI